MVSIKILALKEKVSRLSLNILTIHEVMKLINFCKKPIRFKFDSETEISRHPELLSLRPNFNHGNEICLSLIYLTPSHSV